MRRVLITMAITLLFPIVSLAGWKRDEVGYWYQNDDGTYQTGWYQDVDGRYYYFDTSGYMLANTTTPDGCFVDENGAWIDGGASNVGDDVTRSEHENTLETKITGFGYRSDGTVYSFGYEVPIVIHYNNIYLSERDGIITMKDVVVNGDGVPVISCTIETKKGAEVFQIGETIRYQTVGGNYTDIECTLLNCLSSKEKVEISDEVLGSIDVLETFKKNQITSIEVWLHQ